MSPRWEDSLALIGARLSGVRWVTEVRAADGLLTRRLGAVALCRRTHRRTQSQSAENQDDYDVSSHPGRSCKPFPSYGLIASHELVGEQQACALSPQNCITRACTTGTTCATSWPWPARGARSPRRKSCASISRRSTGTYRRLKRISDASWSSATQRVTG